MRWRRLLLYVTVIAFLVGVLREVELVRLLQTATPIRFSSISVRDLRMLNTGLDLTVIIEILKGLGSYTSRLDWGEVANRLIPPQQPGMQ
jgi:hypothetical protein